MPVTDADIDLYYPGKGPSGQDRRYWENVLLKLLRADIAAGGGGAASIAALAGAFLADVASVDEPILMPGPQGSAGTPGSPGATGLQGAAIYLSIDPDDAFDIPIPGPIGPAGRDGSSFTFSGATGEDGADGADGFPGVAGIAGSTGPQGPQGIAGFDGFDGEDSTIPGPAGANGIIGVNGQQGPPGAPGEDGADGDTIIIPGPTGATGAPGSGGVNAGTATLDFGAFPGGSDASVAVTGQASIIAGSKVTAWLFPATTTDHSADEHIVETLKIFAGNIVAATGFTIYGVNTSQLNEPLTSPAMFFRLDSPTLKVFGDLSQSVGGKGTRIYGKWNIGWLWS